MDIVKEVIEILALKKPHEKDNRLEQLSDVFEYHHGLDKADIIEGVRLLLPAALQEDDRDMRQTFLRAIENAVVHHDIGDCINWDALVTSLPSLEKWDLEYVLNVLGLSGQAKYLPTLDEYAHHIDPEIREWAQEAIREVEYRVTSCRAYGPERRV